MKTTSLPHISLSRRSFLKTSLAASASAALGLSPRAWSQASGANADIRVGVVGLNGRGGSHVSEFAKLKGVRVAALCDVDLRVLEGRAAKLEGVHKYQDVRRLLENKDIDALSIATTNHWHSLMTIWACQAGKDVYVEKPCSHNVFEGRQCVAAARKYQRMVQHGTQQRGGDLGTRIAAIARSGQYGRLLVSKGYCCKPRWSIGAKPVQDPPAHLDFDLWLGPAPRQPYHANLVHYNWHWFWDFGNGDMGNQGVHEMDVARWALDATLPRSVVSLGGRYVDGPNFKDQGQTPNQLVSVFDFGGSLLLFETRGLVGRNPKYPNQVANEFYFEAGVVRGDRFFPKGKTEGEPLVIVDYPRRSVNIFENFIQCMRTRKQQDLCADILEAHLSSALCHLGNASYRLAQERPFAKPQDFTDSDIVGTSIMTLLENTQAIGVDPAKATLWVGPKLNFNPIKERFRGNPEANRLLTREYRPPFVVPPNV
ncbi:MAG: Gfo/Idh/MocA family oxidoreductase [Verrucomicrobia bacterium]|nr:Gfo/Idh/MocA family oxidoreductase [Verrucomicrobiota bacterium]